MDFFGGGDIVAPGVEPAAAAAVFSIATIKRPPCGAVDRPAAPFFPPVHEFATKAGRPTVEVDVGARPGEKAREVEESESRTPQLARALRIP